MGGMSRNKGKVGERELAVLLTTLTGFSVRRRVRNLEGEDDLVGIPGWSIECKRYASITPALVAGWWQQAVEQGKRIGAEPVLFYRGDRGQWRAVWSANMVNRDERDLDELATVESDPCVWWALVEGLTI